ncbi:MAG: hypothetical protein NC517_07550 [Firmicutes bacterium]|nr:hypothetical protein [Bacillota bacterium]
MDGREDIKEELAGEFEARHGDFLGKLARMPVGTGGGEGKEQRLDLFRRYPLRDDFWTEAMQAYRPGAYRRFQERLTDAHKEREKGYGMDEDIASVKNRQDIDNVAFAEAINKAVCSYTGVNGKGERYSFLACLGVLYKQAAQMGAAKNDLSGMGIYDGEIPERNLCRIMKLARSRKNMMQRMGKEASPDKIMDEIREECQGKDWYTAKARELVRTLVFDTVSCISMDGGTDEDGDPVAFQLADERNGTEEAEDREAARDMLKAFCENIERKWALIDSGKGLREKRTIQLFFSSNLLKELKLDGNGQPYPAEPAGDVEFYLLLEPRGGFLYRKLLDEKYLHRALAEYPADFHEVYAKLLRGDFDFSDKVIAELEGKDKSTISRERKKYVELVKALLVKERDVFQCL